MPDATEQEMWEAALDDYVARYYAANPFPTYDELPILERYQAQAIGQTALPWINRTMAAMLLNPGNLGKIMDCGGTPRIVLLTNFPGLVVMKLLLADRPPSFLSVLPHASFESFLAAHPDDSLRWHIVYSCYFSHELEGDVLTLARRKHKLRTSEQYWIQCEICALPSICESGSIHLWKWDGQEMTLLEEGFHKWVSC